MEIYNENLERDPEFENREKIIKPMKAPWTTFPQEKTQGSNLVHDEGSEVIFGFYSQESLQLGFDDNTEL